MRGPLLVLALGPALQHPPDVRRGLLNAVNEPLVSPGLRHARGVEGFAVTHNMEAGCRRAGLESDLVVARSRHDRWNQAARVRRGELDEIGLTEFRPVRVV